ARRCDPYVHAVPSDGENGLVDRMRSVAEHVAAEGAKRFTRRRCDHLVEAPPEEKGARRLEKCGTREVRLDDDSLVVERKVRAGRSVVELRIPLLRRHELGVRAAKLLVLRGKL